MTHPTADWTAQQFRMIVPVDQGHRFVIQDRDTIHTEGVHRTLEAMGLEVLQTPARFPQANTFCERERLIGMIRRECLDVVSIIFARFFESGSVITTAAGNTAAWDLGSAPPPDQVVASKGHQLPNDHQVVATSILGGHHEYRLEAAG